MINASYYEVICPCGTVYHLPNDHMNIQCRECARVLILNYHDARKPLPAPMPINKKSVAA